MPRWSTPRCRGVQISGREFRKKAIESFSRRKRIVWNPKVQLGIGQPNEHLLFYQV